jgi:phosphate-selective porin OprO/OprP
MFVRFSLLFSLTFVAPGLAAAQSPPAASTSAEQPSPAPAASRIVAGEDGFAIESADGNFRLQLGVLLHADGRFALEGANDQFVNSFAVRRLRPYLRGRVARRFEFYVNPELSGGTLVVQDAYVDTVFAPAFRLRAGKAKTPFGFERLHSASNMLFLERALPTALAPNRDIGVQAIGDLYGGLVSYLAGVTNGVADGGSADAETNDSKDLAARLILRPFARQPAGRAARGLGLALAGSRGRAAGAAGLPAFRTQTLQQPYFSYVGGATPAAADGIRTRYSPSVWYFLGPFSGWAEYVRTETPARRGDVAADIGHDAWQAAVSWVLTGESATDAGAGVRPRNNFNFGNGGWGALQIAARYHVLEVDADAIAVGLAAPGASRKADAWTIGLRWYLTGNLWYTVNFERTVFDGNPEGPRRAENAIAFRTHLGF